MADINYSAKELDPLILFSDNHLLAVNKPAGLLTQDSGTGLRNLEDWAREWVRVEKAKPGRVFLNAVHRIDRVASGIVLFARTSKALSRLNEEIRCGNCKKIYHALVEGSPKEADGRLIHWLSHESRYAAVCKEGDPQGKRAELSYRTLSTHQNMTLLEVDLKTGRYHQIRAQLSAMGSPIVGDRGYGAKPVSDYPGIALHHARLEVTHPTLKFECIITAQYPIDSVWQLSLA